MDAISGPGLVPKVLIITGVPIVAFLIYTFYRWYRLSHIPGPFWAGFSKYWMLRESLNGRQPTSIREVTDKYGSYQPPEIRHSAHLAFLLQN